MRLEESRATGPTGVPDDEGTTPGQPPEWLERVEEFSSMIRAVARERGLDDHAVDEVLQDVRVRVWKALGQGDRPVSLTSSYLYQTTMSSALDYLRRQRRQRTVDLDGAAESGRPIAAPRPDPAAAMEGRDLETAVMRAVDELPAPQQAAVKMHLLGHPRRDIARLLAWSEGRTRNMLHRGLTRLRTQLLGWGYGPGEVP